MDINDYPANGAAILTRQTLARHESTSDVSLPQHGYFDTEPNSPALNTSLLDHGRNSTYQTQKDFEVETSGSYVVDITEDIKEPARTIPFASLRTKFPPGSTSSQPGSGTVTPPESRVDLDHFKQLPASTLTLSKITDKGESGSDSDTEASQPPPPTSWRKRYFSWWFSLPFSFRDRVELSFRLALASLLPAVLVLVPTLNKAIVPSSDPTFAAVVAVFVVGENLGETMQFCFESTMGVLLPGILAWFLSSLFGTSLVAVAIYGFISLFVVAYLPLSSFVKKFTLGQLVYYLIDSVSPQPLGLDAAWDVLWFSLFGCASAILASCVPYPRLAQHQVARGLLELIDIMNDLYGTLIVWKGDPYSSVFHRVHVDMLHRKLDEKYEVIQRQFNNIWWEPHPNVNRKKYYQLMMSCAWLRRSLRGMDSSMKHNTFTHTQVSFMKSMRTHTSSMRKACAELLSDLAVDAIENKTDSINASSATLQSTVDKFRAARNRLMARDLFPVSQARPAERPVTAPDGNNDERSPSIASSALNTNASEYGREQTSSSELHQSVRLAFFVFNMEFFALTMLRYADTYQGMETMNWVKGLPTGIPHIKFDLQKMITCLKIAMCLFITSALAVGVYNYSSLAPVNVAYIIGGHVGGSYSISSCRFQGTVLGVVTSYMGLRLIQGNVVAIGFLLFALVFVFGYVRFTPGDPSYVGMVAAYLVPLVLLGNFEATSIDSIQTRALGRIEQTLLGISIFIAVEMLILPVRANVLVYQSMVDFFQSLADKALDVVSPYTGNRCKRCQDHESKNAWEFDLALEHTLVQQEALYAEALCEPALWKRPFPSGVAAALTKYQFTLRNDLAYFVRAIDEASAILPPPSIKRQPQPGDEKMEPLLAQLGSLVSNLAHSLRAVSECISSQDTFVPNSAFDLTKSVVAFEEMYVVALPDLLESGISPFQLLTFNCLLLTMRNFVETTFDIWQTLGRLYDGGDGQEEKHLQRLRALFASGSNAKLRYAKGKSMRKFMREKRRARSAKRRPSPAPSTDVSGSIDGRSPPLVSKTP